MNPGPPVKRPSVTRRDFVAKTGALTSAAWPARTRPLGEQGVFPSGGRWGQLGGRREPVLHWAWLALLPRGCLGDGAGRDHVQEVLPLAVHG